MAEPIELRRALAAFLGGDRFRKFVRQGLRNGRLRYWQDNEWIRFTAANPQFVVGLAELAAALRLGPLPGEGWEKDRRFITVVATVAGAGIALVLHVAAVVGGCYLLHRQVNPPGGRFPDVTPLFYGVFALCLAPLAMQFGAALGVRWAQSRKSGSAGDEVQNPRAD